jgi:hypothetical protein
LKRASARIEAERSTIQPVAATAGEVVEDRLAEWRRFAAIEHDTGPSPSS